MAHEDTSLDNNLKVNYAPTGTDFATIIRANLAQWSSYLENNPSLPEIKKVAPRIMEDIQAALGITGLEMRTMQLVDAVDFKFGQLGLWPSWYPRLMALYGSVMEQSDGVAEAQLFLCLMRYYVHQ